MRIATILVVGLALTAGSSAPAASPDRDHAQQILNAAGVQGGLIVHLGCGDGKLTAALRASDRYVVHGLDASFEHVAAARKHIQSLGFYGKVSVQQREGGPLPYADNLVNLLVVEQPRGVAPDEVQRVLAPLGVALLREGDRWKKIVKPWPQEIGQWTHFLQDASGNAVAQDRTIGPPKRLQWEGGPLWCRSHQFPSSVQAAVSAQGRIFCILDEGPIGVYEKLPQTSALVARDAANGLSLWRQPMRQWGYEYGTGLGDRWHIHHTLPRRLVASGNRVYVTLSFKNSPVSVLDAATGTILTEALEGTKGTDEMLYADGVLAVKITSESPARRSPSPAKTSAAPWRPWMSRAENCCGARTMWASPRTRWRCRIIAWSTTTSLNWCAWMPRRGGSCRAPPRYRAYSRGRHNPGAQQRSGPAPLLPPARRREQGQEQKRSAPPGATHGPLGRRWPRALDRQGDDWPGWRCTQPTDVFVAGGLVWCGGSTEGRDLRTGEVEKTLDLGKVVSPGHHYRCYRSKATECFLIWPKRGAEFIDLAGNNHMRNDWLRAPCFTGMLPANGLLYAPPSQCFCYPGVKLAGFLALAPEGKRSEVRVQGSGGQKPGDPDGGTRLERGIAYGKLSPESNALNPEPRTLNPSDWPMYRHDILRSGAAQAALPADLAKRWEVTLSCPATQPVVAGGRLLVAEKDAQRVRCLNAADGRSLWDFTVGARVDSAPTVYQDLVLFGCHDGSVYCLRAADGALVWRFHAAPADRLVMSFGQLESAWPVHGSVLVQDGIVYFSAGRSSFLDGGILVYGLNPRTGEIIHRAKLEGPWPNVATDVGTPFAMEGAKSDLLVSDQKNLYMQRIKFDAGLKRLDTPQLTTLGDLDMGGRHLLATGGFLDDSGSDRLFWMHGTRWPGFYFAPQAPKSGQLIVFDERTTYSLSYFYRRNTLSPYFIPADAGYLLFADACDNEPILVGKDGKPAAIEWLPAVAQDQRKVRTSPISRWTRRRASASRGPSRPSGRRWCRCGRGPCSWPATSWWWLGRRT